VMARLTGGSVGDVAEEAPVGGVAESSMSRRYAVALVGA
jgi:hypothetical protein